jgi:hypothetical protein
MAKSMRVVVRSGDEMVAVTDWDVVKDEAARLRAEGVDIDALPVNESIRLAYASRARREGDEAAAAGRGEQ